MLEGVVKFTRKYGAFVDLEGEFAGLGGMVHISQISQERVEKVEDVLPQGTRVKVRNLLQGIPNATYLLHIPAAWYVVGRLFQSQ